MTKYETVNLSLVECNIDDMNPEHYPFVMERLFSAGARDAWVTPIIMKGGRPGNCLSVLCDDNHKPSICEILFSETTTLGLRVGTILRHELQRSTVMVRTQFGEIPLKVAVDLNGKELNAAPEFSACKQTALEQGVSLKEVYQAAVSAWTAGKTAS